MPTLYEYFGIKVSFFSNDHEPIHVHGEYQDMESKAEIIVKDGIISEIKIKGVAGRDPLKGRQLKDFESLVSHESEAIVESWNKFFKQNKIIRGKKITKRLGWR